MGRRPGLPKIYFPTPNARVYWCRFTAHGKHYRLSTGSRDPATAQAEADRQHALAQLGHAPIVRRPARAGHSAPPLPLDLLFAEYCVWARAHGKAPSYVDSQEKHYRAHFDARWTRLEHLTADAIERYKVERTQEGAQSVTLYKELVTISRFLRWCVKVKRCLMEAPPFERPRAVSDYEPTDLTRDQVDALLRELPTKRMHPKHMPVREFFTVQWAQSLRPGQVRALRWSDVDLVRNRLRIRRRNEKSGLGRWVGLAQQARVVLDRLAAEPHLLEALIFGPSDYRESLRNAAARAGLPHVTPHHLRHARASEFVASSNDVGAVQFMLGHKNLSTTDRYVRSRTERTEKLLADVERARIPAKVARKPTPPRGRKSAHKK